MCYQSTTGLAADQIEELVARIWQIAQCHEEQLWPPGVGLYRAFVLTLVYVRQNLNQTAVSDLLDSANQPFLGSILASCPSSEKPSALTFTASSRLFVASSSWFTAPTS